ncbi:MAG: hypothetical protein K8R13_03610 [Methanococcoides sp.]|nr:hypothetical protein [Methanococcoides sp.]
MLASIPAVMAPGVGNCKETVNPHGENIPPAGLTTEPGTNPNSGINDDGFFELNVNAGPSIAWVNITFIDNVTQAEIGTITVTNKTVIDTGLSIFDIKIKYTEANGAAPSIKAMGSNNGNGNGQADAVAYHIKGQNDFDWVAELYFADGTLYSTIGPMTGCLVSPPPR